MRTEKLAIPSPFRTGHHIEKFKYPMDICQGT